MGRSPGQTRAIVLINGLHMHPLNKENVAKPIFRDWQGADSRMVKELLPHGDVFAFAYAQHVPIDMVASGSGLAGDIKTLREMGYRDIVLIGHSAGGLVAREFVEDNPDSGVTRVIQVCAPNGGSSWAKLSAVRKNQVAFMKSLTKEARHKALQARQDRVIPEGVQFVCVVGIGAPGGDGLVARECQWSEDLQRQGIPAVALDTTHPTAMRGARSIEAIGKLVTQELKRWSGEQVAMGRKEILAN